MRAIVFGLAIICLIPARAAQADPLTESVQRALKDNGFYYGEVTGRKDADTTAAIRRYQIRNGLHITGEINAETQKALGIKGNAPTTQSTAPPRSTPPVARSNPPRELLDTQTEDVAPTPHSSNRVLPQPAPPPMNGQDYAPAPRGFVPQTRGVFEGTPYETALPSEQQSVVLRTQSLLARQGYYRGPIDGAFSPAMTFALRGYQTHFGLDPTGRMDRETLAVLGLLPGQRAPGLTAPAHPSLRPRPREFTPGGEPIYVPR
jgi:peptidoglycan hydrolase-like protein with peptidoglycan-binding domain